MQHPQSRSVAAVTIRTLGRLSCPESRRLVIKCYVLLARAQVLSLTLTVVGPFATPGLTQLIRRWFDRLKTDATEFSRSLRAHNVAPPVPKSIPALPVSSGPYQNPWV